jgi:hypothetical protein
MGPKEEVQVSITKIRERIERGGKLKVTRSSPLTDRYSQYFVISSDNKEIDFVLSYEFLSDFTKMREYQHFLEEYVVLLEKRFEQPNPLDFYSRSGTAFNIEIRWPISAIANRIASFVHVTVNDIRIPTLVARSAIIFPDFPGQSINPFERQREIVNRIRQALDQQEIAFYAKAAHPHEVPQLEVSSAGEAVSPVSESDLEQFLAGKVYWLAFKRKDKNAKVWIADPWDAQYLGVETVALRQAAQIQDAREVLQVDPQDFGLPGKALLLGGSRFEAQSKATSPLVFVSGTAKSVAVIRNLLRELFPQGISVTSTSEQEPSGAVASDVRSRIERADYVVFDVSGDNPNVFFELGLAHALKKKLLLLVPKDYSPKLPFDIASFLYVPYESENLGGLKSSLSSYIERYWGLPVTR